MPDSVPHDATPPVTQPTLTDANPPDPFRNEIERNLSLLERIAEARVGMLKASMLMNGGGAAAILTFIGHVATSKTPGITPAQLLPSVALFSAGVFLTTLSSAFVFFHLHALAAIKSRFSPSCWTWWMIVIWSLACICFVAGVISASIVFAQAKAIP